MSFAAKTLDELHELALAQLRGRIPKASLAPGSDYWLRSRAVAAAAFGLQQQALDTVRNILPSTADASFLPEHAAVRMGAENAQLLATKAIGKIMVTGDTALTAVPLGTTLSHASGAKYVVTAAGLIEAHSVGTPKVAVGSTKDRVIVDDASSILVDHVVTINSVKRVVRDVIPDVGTPYAIDFYVPLTVTPLAEDAVTGAIGGVIELAAVEAGKAGNLLPGDTLTFDSPITHVDGTAVVLEMSGGSDDETTEELRRRVLSWMAERPGSGNRSDYRQWVRATPDVRIEDACVYVGYRGIGTIDIVPIGVAGARQTGTSVNARITSYLTTVASELDDVLVRQLIDGAAIDVTVALSTGSDFIADWAGEALIDVGSSTTEVQLTAPPTAIPLGARVLVYVGTGPRPGLYQRVVTGKTGTSIQLDQPLPAAPSAGAHVDAGGPVTQAAIDAINTLFDNLGPGDGAGARRFPEGADAWEWVLRPEQIAAAVLAVEGVDGADVQAPTDLEEASQFARLRLGVLRLGYAPDSIPSL